MTSRGNDRWTKYLGIGIPLGVTIGAGFGIVLESFSLGIGPGIALGIAIALAMSNRRSGKAGKSTQDAQGRGSSDDDGEA